MKNIVYLNAFIARFLAQRFCYINALQSCNLPLVPQYKRKVNRALPQLDWYETWIKNGLGDTADIFLHDFFDSMKNAAEHARASQTNDDFRFVADIDTWYSVGCRDESFDSINSWRERDPGK